MLDKMKAAWEHFKYNPFLWLVVIWLLIAICMNLYVHGEIVW
ncbi:hypothetical protein [Providencia phage PSTCR2]|uniref:Uncharacterized protein n=1 Tax=Providencia phage PSTCR2 TaxID=2783544 RepID=A0A873WN19_9CAUD|nr:hypothetical protein [Providencia phage PSTCR2]